MATDFPANPSNGDTHAGFTYNSTTGAWESSASAGTEPPVILTEPPTTTQALNSDGTTSTVTMTAQDPDGFDITYGIAYKTAGNALPAQLASATTINQSTGVYTFTPSTTTSNAGSFTARLSATDGIGYTTRLVNFDLRFGFQLWRLNIVTASNHGLWDIEPETTGGIHGWYTSGGTSLTAPMSPNYGSVPTAGTYGVYFSSTADPFTDNTSLPTGLGTSSTNTFMEASTTSNRAYFDSIAGRWIYMYFTTGNAPTLTDISGSDLGLRTFAGARPDRTPNSFTLQYYDGTIGSSYNSSNWVTYATLTANQTHGWPKWLNITSGSTIASTA